MAAIEKFVRIFATTVPAFLPREKPISRKAKPACMNITTMPATITHMELMRDGVRQGAVACGVQGVGHRRRGREQRQAKAEPEGADH